MWYELTLRALQPSAPGQYDFLWRREVGERDADALRRQYGSLVRYARAKHQLDRRPLRRHALVTAAYPDDSASSSASGHSAGK